MEERGGGAIGAGIGGGMQSGGGGGMPEAQLAGTNTLCSSSLGRSVKSRSHRVRALEQEFTNSSQCSSVSVFLISGGFRGGVSDVGLFNTSPLDCDFAKPAIKIYTYKVQTQSIFNSSTESLSIKLQKDIKIIWIRNYPYYQTIIPGLGDKV